MSMPNGPYKCQGCGNLIEWDPEARVYMRPNVTGPAVISCTGVAGGTTHVPDGKGAIESHTPIDLTPGDMLYLEQEREGNLGEVIDRRVQVYGDPVIGFTEIAAMWSVLFDCEVPAWKVPIAQALMKVVRMKTSPDYSDHSDDIAGYLDIFRKVIGDDMIEARTVNEYIEKKWPELVPCRMCLRSDCQGGCF